MLRQDIYNILNSECLLDKHASTIKWKLIFGVEHISYFGDESNRNGFDGFFNQAQTQ